MDWCRPLVYEFHAGEQSETEWTNKWGTTSKHSVATRSSVPDRVSSLASSRTAPGGSSLVRSSSGRVGYVLLATSFVTLETVVCWVEFQKNIILNSFGIVALGEALNP